MKYRALVSFTGLVSMAKGDVRDISDTSIAGDLLKAGYIEEANAPVKEAAAPKKAAEKEPAKKTKTTAKKGGKK